MKISSVCRLRRFVRPRLQSGLRSLSTASSASTEEAHVAALQNLRDLLDSDPAAASNIAKQLGATTCAGLAASVRKYTETNPDTDLVTAPPFSKLRAVFVGSAVPFIGFGIIDNSVMLAAGDQIDLTLGVSLGISTLAAAGIGNMVSDVGGVWAGGVIERMSAQLGIAAPMLTRGEERHKRTKTAENLGSAFGVTLGCIIGMFPLLFIDSKKAENLKRKASSESIFREIFLQVPQLLHAERATLFLLSEDKSHLWSLVGQSDDGSSLGSRVQVPVNNSVAGLCVMERKSMRVEDAYKHPKFFGAVDRETGFKTRDLLCAPIVNSDNEIVGIIQVVNSDRENGFASRGALRVDRIHLYSCFLRCFVIFCYFVIVLFFFFSIVSVYEVYDYSLCSLSSPLHSRLLFFIIFERKLLPQMNLS